MYISCGMHYKPYFVQCLAQRVSPTALMVAVKQTLEKGNMYTIYNIPKGHLQKGYQGAKILASGVKYG